MVEAPVRSAPAASAAALLFGGGSGGSGLFDDSDDDSSGGSGADGGSLPPKPSSGVWDSPDSSGDEGLFGAPAPAPAANGASAAGAASGGAGGAGGVGAGGPAASAAAKSDEGGAGVPVALAPPPRRPALGDRVAVSLHPRNADFLSPGQVGTVMDVDDADPLDVWFTVEDAAGETDEYCEADLVVAQPVAVLLQLEPVPEPMPKPELESESESEPEPELEPELVPEPELEPMSDPALDPEPEPPVSMLLPVDGGDPHRALVQKIAEFLGDIPIGTPGAEGATSQRGFDANPLVEFAEQAGLHDATAEEIYIQFVEAKTREAEEMLMGDPGDGFGNPNETGTLSSTGADENHPRAPEPDAAAVAQQAQYADLYAQGALQIRKQQRVQQARKSTRIEQLKKERDDAVWMTSQLQLRCEATDEIVKSLHDEAEHTEATILTAMEDMQELRDRLAASERERLAVAADMATVKHELLDCRGELESTEMELQMETTLVQSVSKENRRLSAEHAEAIARREAAVESEAAMKKKLGEVEHILPRYLEQQEVRGRKPTFGRQPITSAAVPTLLGTETASAVTPSVRTMAFVHGLGFHRRQAAAAAVAAADAADAAAAVVVDTAADADASENPPLPGTKDSDSDDSDIEDLLFDTPVAPPNDSGNDLQRGVDTQNSEGLGFQCMSDGELDSLSFLDEVEVQRSSERAQTIVWADSTGDSSNLAVVHPYSLAAEFSLHRKVRSRAVKREEKQAKEEARRERRERKQLLRKLGAAAGHQQQPGDDDSSNGDGNDNGNGNGNDGDERKHKHKHKHHRRRKRSDDTSRRHSADVSGQDDGDLEAYALPCILTGPSGETLRLSIGESFEVGRKTLGIESPKVHRQHLRVAFINKSWAIQKLGKNPGYILPQTADGPVAAAAEGGSDDTEETEETEECQNLQYHIDDEPGWSRLEDGDCMYLSKVEPELCVIFGIAPPGHHDHETTLKDDDDDDVDVDDDDDDNDNDDGGGGDTRDVSERDLVALPSPPQGLPVDLDRPPMPAPARFYPMAGINVAVWRCDELTGRGGWVGGRVLKPDPERSGRWHLALDAGTGAASTIVLGHWDLAPLFFIHS